MNKKSSGRRSRRLHSPAFKAKVVLVGLRENKTIAERKAMIHREHPLSVTRQARLLEISRGALYFQPRPTSEADLALMRRIDELHLEHPFMGARMIRRANQVWALDTTYITMARGFVYLAAVVDVKSSPTLC